jgi:hypothetical protein
MVTRLSSLSLVLITMLFSAPGVQAERRADGNGHVVHSRMAPVLLHRAVPPFKGVHTYQGQASRNRQ